MQNLAGRIEAAPAVDSVAFTSHLYYGSGYLSLDIDAETADDEMSTTKI